jgi:hypothetical protein
VARTSRRVGALLAVGLLLALVGCGGGGSSGGTVDVRLTDYDVILSEPSVGAGTVELVVANAGGFVHELLLVRSDLAIDELPKTADGRFDEQGTGVTVVASADDIPAAGTATLTQPLDAGGYYLICNRPPEAGDPLSHFAHGMLAPLTVT